MKVGLDDQALQEQRGKSQPDEERVTTAPLARACRDLAQVAPIPVITAAAGAPLRAVRQIYLGAEARWPTRRSGRSLKESPARQAPPRPAFPAVANRSLASEHRACLSPVTDWIRRAR